jgi:DNA polymerase (family 10)
MAEKKEIIYLLEEIADLMEFKGEIKFKINAFRSGANSIRRFQGDFNALAKDRKLDGIKGIGKGLQSVIYEYCEKDSSNLLSELSAEIPAGIKELFAVRGLGAKKISVLYSELGIASLGELEYACKENRISLLKGFGKATQKKILTEIEKIKFNSKFVLLSTADHFHNTISQILASINQIQKFEISGEFRRGTEIISRLDYVLLTESISDLFPKLQNHFRKEELKNTSFITRFNNLPLQFHITENISNYFNKLFLSTGSQEFLNRIAILTDYISCESEEQIFSSAGINYLIPEMREKEYFEVQDKKLLSNSNLSITDFKGLLHFHTTYSDGGNSLLEMTTAAKELGFNYAAVCDHSKSAFYANGLNEERLIIQRREIVEVSSKLSFQIFHGIESDILADGKLDYDEEILKQFDFIVASVHSRFNLSKEEMTNRIVRAVENPYTDLLGHPSGRLLLSRDPYQVDIRKVIDACAVNNTAIEINANPHRLDLDWRWIYYAREKGCKFSINADAHSTEDILLTKYGVITARKGGMQTEEVINCFNQEDFKLFLNRKVSRKF